MFTEKDELGITIEDRNKIINTEDGQQRNFKDYANVDKQNNSF